MLLSKSMYKKDLDKSSNSVSDQFIKVFKKLNGQFDYLNNEFLELLGTVTDLQGRLKVVTEDIREVIDEYREDWTDAGLDTTPLDQIEEIIDQAEEEL